MPLATSVRGFEIALLALVVASSIGIGCRDVGSSETASDTAEGSAGLTSSLAASPSGRAAVRDRAEARARIEALRQRFQITPVAAPARPGRPAMEPKPVPVIGAGIVGHFEMNDATTLRAVIPVEARRGIQRTASVELPRRANGSARLEDDTSHVSVRFALRGAKDAPVAVADGIALYAGALGGADVVHRVHAEGTEDYVVFEEKPAREEIAYDVDVSRAAGLRLVSHTLEFLDERGSPQLRIAPPYVVDARGERHEATLAVEGCAYDVNPAAPWGREVTRPGAGSCVVRVAWGGGVAYPAIVDPTWTVTGSLGTPRESHTASVLASGMVLITGGDRYEMPKRQLFHTVLRYTELYDPASGRFADTGLMTTPRIGHTASVLASGMVLVAGGTDDHGDDLASAELYDPVSGGFTKTGSMTMARRGHTASVLPSGKVLVAGGVNGLVLASAELYDPVSVASSKPVR